MLYRIICVFIIISSLFTALNKNQKYNEKLEQEKTFYNDIISCENLSKENKYSEMLTCTTKLIEKYPNDYYSKYYYALALMYNDKTKEAKNEFQNILNSNPSNKEVIEKSKYFIDKLAELERLDRHDIGDYFVDVDKYSIWKNPENIKVYIYDDYQKSKLLKSAFINWDNSLYGMVNFTYVQTPDEADITIKATPREQSIKACNLPNAVGCATSLTYHYKSNPNRLFFKKVNILIAIDIDGKPVSDKYFYAVTLHEIGHALGIQTHSPNIADAMYASTDSYAQRRAKITNRDVNTIKRIYGNI